MKKIKVWICVLLFTVTIFVSCSRSETNRLEKSLKIEEERPISKLVDLSDINGSGSAYVLLDSNSQLERSELKELPELQDEYNPFAIDLRSYNLSNFNLTNYKDELDVSIFDNNTIWPDDLPVGFDPNEILKKGKDPGLGIRDLHEKGITGKGINVAIIDSALFIGHEEYSKNLKTYEFIHCLDESAQMHGSLVTSLLVGENIGVAPGANVYYIASTAGDYLESGPELNYNYIVEGINRVLDINKQLPTENKIRIISISLGFSKNEKGYDNVIKAINEANEKDVFVLTVTPELNFDYHIKGLSRQPLSDPNAIESYEIGSLLYFGPSYDPNELQYDFLLAPMDNRTSALFTGPKDYQYLNQGGNSLIVPWVAGLYALCLQVEPEFNPEKFFELAYNTADLVEFKNSRHHTINARIFNPQKIISEINKND